MMFSHHNLVSGNNFTYPWQRSSASMVHSTSESSWLLSDEQINPNLFAEAHNCDSAPSFSANSHPNLLRLDSTGEVVQEGSAPFNSNTVLNSLIHHQENFVKMANYPQSPEMGFGQRYSQHRRKNHHHRNWTKPKERPKVGNCHDGYPFYQFAMATAPSEVSVKFYGFHGDTQVLNMDQLFPQFRNTGSRPNPGGTNPVVANRRGAGVMNNKASHKTETRLCDALGKMSFSACHSVGEESSMADRISVPSQQMGSQDSGFFETLPHLVDGLSPVSPQMNTSDGDEDNLSPAQKSNVECVDCPGSVQVEEAFNDCSVENKTLLENTENRTNSSSPFLMSVINTDDVDDDSDDSDSEIEVSDEISLFDSDDSDMDEDGDPCSRNSELELLTCFFPDDPYNPFNFARSCSRNYAPKRPVPVVDADDIEPLSDTSCARKRVRFVSDSELAEVHEEETSLADDYQEARCGPWEEFARGRERFKRRVTELEPILAPCLTDAHRQQMWDLIHS